MTAHWNECDAMLSLPLLQQEQLLELIGSQNDSKRIARMIGCAEDIVKIIRTERQRQRKMEQRREQYQRELNRTAVKKRVEGVKSDWPQVDGRRLDHVLIAMGHPMPVNCAAPLGMPVMISGRVSVHLDGGVMGPWS